MKASVWALLVFSFAVLAHGQSPLTSVTIGGQAVLANSQGRTVYTFDPDQLNKSNCIKTCAVIWPPVTVPNGTVLNAPASTIVRADGGIQVTYKGHPLYTYSGDHAPGQDNGNGLNGVWHIVTE